MKTPPKALGVKTRTEPSHSWLSGLLLPGQTADPPAERLLGRLQHVPGRRRRNAPLVPTPPTARSHGARQPGDYSRPAIPARQPARPMGLQGLRDRSRCSAEAWWRRFAGKYAVAVAFVGARKGPDRIAPHSGYNCSACLTGRTSCSLATTLGCSTPEGRLGTPRYQARELLIGIILRSRAASRERASNPIRRRSSRSAEGDAAAGWPIRNTGDPNSDDNSGGGPRGARYQARELLVNIHPVLQCSIPGARFESNLPIAGADHPDQPKATHPPISTLQMGRPATPFRGAPGNRCKRATHRRHPAVQCSIQGRARFPGRFFYEARRPLLRSMRNCSKTAPGDTSRRYPHLRRFQGGAREIGRAWGRGRRWL